MWFVLYLSAGKKSIYAYSYSYDYNALNVELKEQGNYTPYAKHAQRFSPVHQSS